MQPKLPPLKGVIDNDSLILRQSAGEGSLGDTKIYLSSTAGLGGFALIVEVERPSKSRTYCVYNLAPLVKQIAQAVIDAESNAKAPQ